MAIKVGIIGIVTIIHNQNWLLLTFPTLNQID